MIKTVSLKNTEATFFDLKKQKKVNAKAIEKVTNGKRFWFRAKADDGRALTVIVGKDAWEAAK